MEKLIRVASLYVVFYLIGVLVNNIRVMIYTYQNFMDGDYDMKDFIDYIKESLIFISMSWFYPIYYSKKDREDKIF
jgi:amino acid permease